MPPCDVRPIGRIVALPSYDVKLSYANRNETKHLPYGEGTLRAEPLGEALARYARRATVITESPDEASHQAIRSVLIGSAARTT
jgi:hypothetical protein